MLLLLVGLASRDEANDAALGAVAVADEEHPEGPTETEKNESVLTVRMVWIVDQERVIVYEY